MPRRAKLEKPNDKIRSIETLKHEIFTIKCRSITGDSYTYQYRIKDVEECAVEYLS